MPSTCSRNFQAVAASALGNAAAFCSCIFRISASCSKNLNSTSSLAPWLRPRSVSPERTIGWSSTRMTLRTRMMSIFVTWSIWVGFWTSQVLEVVRKFSCGTQDILGLEGQNICTTILFDLRDLDHVMLCGIR